MSDDSNDPLIQKALSKIEHLHAEIVRLKIFVNEADKLHDRQPRFSDVDAASPQVTATIPGITRASAKRWKPGDFFGESFSGAVRRILSARKEASGGPSPASVDEIHEALTQGSYSFETNGVEAQKNSIRISLGKNSYMFVKLPNSDLFGLAEWYGLRGKRSGSKRASGAQAEDEGTDDGQRGDGEESTSESAGNIS